MIFQSHSRRQIQRQMSNCFAFVPFLGIDNTSPSCRVFINVTASSHFQYSCWMSLLRCGFHEPVDAKSCPTMAPLFVDLSSPPAAPLQFSMHFWICDWCSCFLCCKRWSILSYDSEGAVKQRASRNDGWDDPKSEGPIITLRREAGTLKYQRTQQRMSIHLSHMEQYSEVIL